MFYYLPYMEENANQGKFRTALATVLFRIVEIRKFSFLCNCTVYHSAFRYI